MINNPYHHLHHADTVKLLELGRLKFLDALDIPNEQLIAEGYAIVVAEINVRFKRELTSSDVTVTVDKTELRSKLIVMNQSIVLPNKETAVLAEVVCIGISPETRRSIPPPEIFIEKIKAFYDE